NKSKRSERNIDKEDPMPRNMLNQPSTENWTQGSCDRGEGGPSPDCFTTRLFVEARADNSEAAWYKRRPGDALNRAPDQQRSDRGRKTTANGSECETDYTKQEHDPAA